MNKNLLCLLLLPVLLAIGVFAGNRGYGQNFLLCKQCDCFNFDGGASPQCKPGQLCKASAAGDPFNGCHNGTKICSFPEVRDTAPCSGTCTVSGKDCTYTVDICTNP